MMMGLMFQWLCIRVPFSPGIDSADDLDVQLFRALTKEGSLI